MATDQQTDHDHPTTREPTTTREREIIVTNGNGGGGNGVGATILAIVGILVVLLVGWFAIQAISGSDGGGVDVPDEINLNVDDGSGGGGETGGGETGGQ